MNRGVGQMSYIMIHNTPWTFFSPFQGPFARLSTIHDRHTQKTSNSARLLKSDTVSDPVVL